MKTLIAVVCYVSLAVAGSADSIERPAKDTGVLIKITGQRIHQPDPKFRIISVEVRNNSKEDYFIRTSQQADPSKLFEKLNPSRYTCSLSTVGGRPLNRDNGIWKLESDFPPPVPGDDWGEFPSGAVVRFEVPVTALEDDSDPVANLALYFAKLGPRGGKNPFYLVKPLPTKRPNKLP